MHKRTFSSEFVCFCQFAIEITFAGTIPRFQNTVISFCIEDKIYDTISFYEQFFISQFVYYDCVLCWVELLKNVAQKVCIRKEISTFSAQDNISSSTQQLNLPILFSYEQNISSTNGDMKTILEVLSSYMNQGYRNLVIVFSKTINRKIFLHCKY